MGRRRGEALSAVAATASPFSSEYDVIVIGAGSAGLMCAIETAGRSRRVLVLDHAPKIGEKIRISGGGRCNFTNIKVGPEDFISNNPQFCISALKSFTPEDFIARLNAHDIAWHEKHMGQLFCDGPAQQVVDMLLGDCMGAGVVIAAGTAITRVEKTASGFAVEADGRTLNCASLVIATGGKSIPKIGASGFGYNVARQFGLAVIEPRPGLVPLTFNEKTLAPMRNLAGVALPARAVTGRAVYADDLLFTHRGLSGPVILKISSHWRPGTDVMIDMVPDVDVLATLKIARTEYAKQDLHTVLSQLLPKRLARYVCDETGTDGRMADLADAKLTRIADRITAWHVRPEDTEGFRTAEVTVGGVDTHALSSKTFECRDVPGLYFIGEVVDVTGNLGGYNFQWAWASGFAAGQYA